MSYFSYSALVVTIDAINAVPLERSIVPHNNVFVHGHQVAEARKQINSNKFCDSLLLQRLLYVTDFNCNELLASYIDRLMGALIRVRPRYMVATLSMCLVIAVVLFSLRNRRDTRCQSTLYSSSVRGPRVATYRLALLGCDPCKLQLLSTITYRHHQHLPTGGDSLPRADSRCRTTLGAAATWHAPFHCLLGRTPIKPLEHGVLV